MYEAAAYGAWVKRMLVRAKHFFTEAGLEAIDTYACNCRVDCCFGWRQQVQFQS